ncbi:MAG: hypothetical protein ACHQX3_05015 [Nitrospirales bacterium]
MSITSEESKTNGRIGVLYRFCRDLQGNELVALVYLVFLAGLVHLVQPNKQDKQNKPDKPLGLGLAGRLCLFSL